MAPSDHRRPYKRPAISDQQRRRDHSLLRQAQNRLDAQQRARCLASSILSLENPETDSVPDLDSTTGQEQSEVPPKEFDVRQASKLRGVEARRWFARQLMLPEWMIDVPDRLSRDWYVFARPAGKRCFVVSSNGATVSRLRNGSILHRFPSALPSGSRSRDASGTSQSYSIMDCIFHEPDQTYYVIDILCWRGYSLYDCSAEFRFFWLNSKLAESGACGPPSQYHRYRFSLIPVYNCDHNGLSAAYMGAVPYVKDGLLFYNKEAKYQTGNTPLALVWKDENCSQYVIDTDNQGNIPIQQQEHKISIDCLSKERDKMRSIYLPNSDILSLYIWNANRMKWVVLELQDDGKLNTSDDPPVAFGCLDSDFVHKSGLHSGNLLRFSIGDNGLSFMEERLDKADLCYIGKSNRARAFADSYSKIVFQHMVRHSPLKMDDFLSSITSSDDQENQLNDIEMTG